MTVSYGGQAVADAMLRVCAALKTQVDALTSLDQAVGDGDMGYTLGKIADALTEYAKTTSTADLGKFLGGAGMLANKVGPSTMGTLLATALMRAGKVVMGKAELTPGDLVAMLQAAEVGMQERGKAQLGDKTILDALHPANEAFAAAIAAGERRSRRLARRRSPRPRPGETPSPPAAARSAARAGSASAPRARSIPAARRWW